MRFDFRHVMAPLFVLWQAAACGGVLDPLLQRVPDEAGLVIIVPNLTKLAEGLSQFGAGIESENLSTLTVQQLLEDVELLGDFSGLDMTGPLLWVRIPYELSPLMIVRLSDTGAWRDTHKTSRAHPHLFHVEVVGESGYAGLHENVLICSAERALVQAALDSDGRMAAKLKDALGDLPAKHEILVYVDVPDWMPMIESVLTGAAFSIQTSMAMASPQDQSAVRMWRWIFKEAGQFVRQCESWVGGLHVSGEGLFYEDRLRLKAGSPVADYLKRIARSREPLLRGMPADPGAFIFAAEWEDPGGTVSLNERWLKAMIDEREMREKLGPEKFEKAWSFLVASYDHMRGFNLSCAAAGEDAGMLIVGHYFSDEPEAIIANMVRSMEISPEFMNALSGAATMKLDIREAEVGDKLVQVLDMTWQVEDLHMQRVLEAMYGKQTSLYFLPQPERDLVLYTMGPSEAALARLEQQLKGTGKPLLETPRVQQILSKLSPHPQVLLLVDLPPMFGFVLEIARATGAPLPAIAIKDKELPYVGWALFLDPERVRNEICVPIEPLKSMGLVVDQIKRSER